jgi:hypothetical protein
VRAISGLIYAIAPPLLNVLTTKHQRVKDLNSFVTNNYLGGYGNNISLLSLVVVSSLKSRLSPKSHTIPTIPIILHSHHLSQNSNWRMMSMWRAYQADQGLMTHFLDKHQQVIEIIYCLASNRYTTSQIPSEKKWNVLKGRCDDVNHHVPMCNTMGTKLDINSSHSSLFGEYQSI